MKVICGASRKFKFFSYIIIFDIRRIEVLNKTKQQIIYFLGDEGMGNHKEYMNL